MNFDVKVSRIKLALTPDKKIRKALSRAGAKAVEIIRERTNQGKFLGGVWKDKPYSETYFKSKNTQDKTVNLQRTNHMMSSMQSRAIVSKRRMLAEVYFSGVNANKKAFWNNQTRRFFDLTDKELDQVQRVFKANINA